MKGSIPLSLFTASVVATSQVLAAESIEEAEPRQYLGFMGTYVVPDEDRQLARHGVGGSLLYGRQLSEHWWWESQAGAFGQDSGVDNSSDYYQYMATTGLNYALGDRKGFTPYIAGGLGVIYNDVLPDDDDAYDLTANAGVGAVTGPIFDNGLKLRAEARYIYDDFDGAEGDGVIPSSADDGGFGDWHFSVGLEIPLGYTRVKEVEKVVYKTKEVEKVVEKPFVDSDGDGVSDERDECPDTIRDAKVDSKGCMITNQTITFNNINFEFNSAKITSSSRPSLDRVVKALKAQTDFNVEVAGHTDSVGSAAYNETLSDKRANSVRDYLVGQGVDAGRLTAKGYGELEPIASNDSESGRAMNRRVEFRVTEK